MGDTAKRRQPDKSTGQGRHTKETRGPELYPTPPAATMALMRVIPHVVKAPIVRVWEPASGLGHMALPLQKQYVVKCSDIIDYGARLEGTPEPTVVNFLETPPFPLGDQWAIITNPPFSVAADFVRHGLRMVPTVMILERLAFLESRGRSDILDNHLDWVLPFDRRLPFMHRWSKDEASGTWKEWSGPKATSAMPFAWFVFRRWTSGTKMERITWLDDDLNIETNLIQSGSPIKEPA